MTKLGIDEHWLDLVRQTLLRHGAKKAVIFGSRARGDFKDYSDIDLAVWAPLLTAKAFSKMNWDLDELPLLFKMDVLRMDQGVDATLSAQIGRDGVNLI